jgi:hypothetical protein
VTTFAELDRELGKDAQKQGNTRATLNCLVAEYHLTLTVLDAAHGGHQRATAMLHVRVLDVNDNAPRFERPVYTGYLMENALEFSQVQSDVGFVVKVGMKQVDAEFW